LSRKIDLFIVGAQKCGTTSLKNYLGEHPDINGQIQTEMTYFTNDEEYGLGFDNAYKTYFSKDKNNAKIRIAKYVSLCQSEYGLLRLKEHNQNCKIVLMVRNPIERALSSYMMEQSVGGENRSFDEVIEYILKHKDIWQYRAIISYGFYNKFINNILNYFDRGSMRVVILEELKQKPECILEAIFSWLDVNDSFMPDLTKIHNKGGVSRSKKVSDFLLWFLNEKNILKRCAKIILPNQLTSKIGFELRQFNKDKNKTEIMPENTRKILQKLYEPHNKELSQFIGRKSPIWPITKISM